MKATSLNFRKAFFLLLLSSLSQFSIAQDNAVSLENRLKKANIHYDKNPQQAIVLTKQLYQHAVNCKCKLQELKSLKLLTYFYWGIQDMTQAEMYVKKGIYQAKKYQIDSLLGDFYTLNGALNQTKNQYPAALQSYEQSIIYYKRGRQIKKIAATWINLGVCEMKLSNFESANRYYLQSATVFDQLKDISSLSSVYNSIGVCFSSLGNYRKALNYHHSALTFRRQLRDTTLQAQSMNNIGLAFIEEKQPDSALYYLYQCINIRKKEKDSSILILTLQNVGAAYQQKNELEKSEHYFLRSLHLAQQYDRKEDEARAKLDLAGLYLQLNSFKKALEVTREARLTAIELKLTELIMNTDELNYHIYEKMGDHQNALIYYKRFITLKDRLFSLIKNKRIAELEIQYQTVKKENNIISLNIQNALQKKAVEQQRLFIIGLIVSALLLSSLLVVTFRSYRIKNRANQRIQTLMHELNHRVKNNLQILSGLFSLQIHELTDETAKNALRENETRLASMNLIHNKLYHNPVDTKIEMQEYLTKLLEHIKNTFGGKQTENVHLAIEVEKIYLEADTAVAIGLIINELTTNAIKYAFDAKGGQIYLKFKQLSPNAILLKLGDNGKGIVKNKEKHSTSFGLKLVHMMAKQLRSALIIKNGNGTTYEMEIKI